MSLTSGFFNSVNNDRLYDAEQMSAIFDGLINDGIYDTIGTGFQVTPTSELTVNVGVGRAWLNHCWISNDAAYPITLGAASASLGRIDTVCLKVDHSLGVRSCSIVVLNGVTSASPVAPDVPADDTENGVYYHPIADISVAAGTTAIAQSMITNRVGLSTGTPYVTGIISATTLDQLWAQLEGQFMDWWDTIRTVLDNDIALRLQNEIDHITPTEETMNLYGFSHMNPPPEGKEYKAFSTDAILKKVDNKINTIDTGNIGDVMAYDGDISAISDNFVQSVRVSSSGNYAMFLDPENGAPLGYTDANAHDHNTIINTIVADYTTTTQSCQVDRVLYKDGYAYALMRLYPTGNFSAWFSAYIVKYDEKTMTKISEHVLPGVSYSTVTSIPGACMYDSHGRMAFFSTQRYQSNTYLTVLSNDNGDTWSKIIDTPSSTYNNYGECGSVIFDHFLCICMCYFNTSKSNLSIYVLTFNFDTLQGPYASNTGYTISTGGTVLASGYRGFVGYANGTPFVMVGNSLNYSKTANGYAPWTFIQQFIPNNASGATIGTYAFNYNIINTSTARYAQCMYYDYENDAYYVAIANVYNTNAQYAIYAGVNQVSSITLSHSSYGTGTSFLYPIGEYSNGWLHVGSNANGATALNIKNGVVNGYKDYEGAGYGQIEHTSYNNDYIYAIRHDANGVVYASAEYNQTWYEIYFYTVTPTAIGGATAQFIKRISK